MAPDATGAAPTPHRWTVLLSLGAMLISLCSLGLGLLNYRQVKRYNWTHLKPDVMCTVRHTTLPAWTNSPWTAEVVVLNRGPIKAGSVYVGYKTWIVDTNLWWPYCSPGVVEYLNKNYSFVVSELDVGEGRSKNLLSVGPMAIYEVEVSYYRPSDMEKFVEKALFFYHDGHFYDEIGFQQKPFYPNLVRNLERCKAGKAGIIPDGKTAPPPGAPPPDFLLHVPDDNESPRVLRAVDFH